MLLDDYDRNVDARRQLTAMARVQDTLPAWRIEPPPPADELLGYYHEAESQSGVGWNYLAAINLIETRFGSINGVSTAGAQGPMQFLPSTFAAYAEGGDIHSPRDSIMAAAASSPRMALPTTMIGPSTGTTTRTNTCGRSTNTRRCLPPIPSRSPATTGGTSTTTRARATCCCPSATPRRHRYRSETTWQATRSNSPRRGVPSILRRRNDIR
ncbi:transglycosylase SLT domain protein [Mycobacterium xenopi 3993]|nr:transglycosylase SLT domain protein [Mycobacterium xenopi 3993]